MDKKRIVIALALLSTQTVLLTASTAQASTLLSPGTHTVSDPGAWSWPLSGTPELLRPFEAPEQRWSPGHRGIDLGAVTGLTVRAPAPGVISYHGVVVDRPVLVIDHGHGLVSSFEPVADAPELGTVVETGDELGSIAAGGHCDGRCLHWGLRLDGEYIDPLLTISDRRPSVLLPLGG